MGCIISDMSSTFQLWWGILQGNIFITLEMFWGNLKRKVQLTIRKQGICNFASTLKEAILLLNLHRFFGWLNIRKLNSLFHHNQFEIFYKFVTFRTYNKIIPIFTDSSLFCLFEISIRVPILLNTFFLKKILILILNQNLSHF